MTERLEIRDATESDRDRAVALLAAAHGAPARDAAGWDWLFQGRLERYAVADAGAQLAAQYALLPLRVQHRGAVVDASLSLDTATHPDFTGRGLMTDLALRVYERPGAELVFGFPNRSSSWIFYNRLDWREVPAFPLLFRPLPGIARALAPISLPKLPSVRRGHAERAEPFDEFGFWADEIWSRTSSALGTAVVHDSTYLNWRFAKAPFTYDRFLVRAAGDPVAYAVVRTVPWRRGHLSYLMELAALPGARKEANAALEAVLGQARAEGAAGIVALATPRNPLRDLLLARGFRTPPTRMLQAFSFGVRLAGELKSHTEAEQIEGWHLTAADFDHV